MRPRRTGISKSRDVAKKNVRCVATRSWTPTKQLGGRFSNFSYHNLMDTFEQKHIDANIIDHNS
jgi:hypothetical protein